MAEDQDYGHRVDVSSDDSDTETSYSDVESSDVDDKPREVLDPSSVPSAAKHTDKAASTSSEPAPKNQKSKPHPPLSRAVVPRPKTLDAEVSGPTETVRLHFLMSLTTN